MPDRDPTPRYRLLGVVERDVQPIEEKEPDDDVFTWPHFLTRHVVVGAATVLVVFALAILFNAPLKDIANPNQTPEVAKAPWYFAGLQELLSHFTPMVAGVLIPGALLYPLSVVLWRLEALPAFAASGALFSSGFADKPPCWLPGYAAHDAASLFAVVGALAAVLERGRHGRGQTVDVCVQEAGIQSLHPWSIPTADYARVYPMLTAVPLRAAERAIPEDPEFGFSDEYVDWYRVYTP
jgi:hypothetical protein